MARWFSICLVLLTMPIVSAAEPFSPRDHSRRLKVGTLQRTYLLHVPKSYDGTKPLPVVLAFHGGGSHAQAMVEFCGLNETADKADRSIRPLPSG